MRQFLGFHSVKKSAFYLEAFESYARFSTFTQKAIQGDFEIELIHS